MQQQAQFSFHSLQELTLERQLALNKELLSFHPHYIYQQEPPQFTTRTIHEIRGYLAFGDAIDDEWFLCHLLLKLTTTNPDLIISIKDEDGEFLLIEAAEQLDSKFSPENCDNRVYLYRGELHIIPLKFEFGSLQEALKLVASDIDTRAPVKVQEAAFSRLLQYENGIEHIFHRARVLLPIQLANALHHYPELIAKFVTALYTREDVLLNSFKQQKLEKPDFVEMNVKFTKILYAQLSSVELPNISNSEYPIDFKLGLKLVIGCDIFKQSYNETMNDSQDWLEYLNNLKQLGYFKGEIEGSQLYNVYINVAKQSFQEKVTYNQILAGNLKKIWNTETVDKDLFIQGIVDDDSYLNTTMENVDTMLQQNMNLNSDDDFVILINKSSISSNDEQLQEIKEMATNFNMFMNEESDVRGVKVNGDLESDSDDGNYQPLSFNADKYMTSLSFGIDDNDFTRDSTEKDDIEMIDLMGQMDNEINRIPMKGSNGSREVDDVDSNLITNFLDSVISQQGMSGPTSNIMQSLGLKLNGKQ